MGYSISISFALTKHSYLKNTKHGPTVGLAGYFFLSNSIEVEVSMVFPFSSRDEGKVCYTISSILNQ